jgi:glycosyltransferase involved in cell wall biosynthesis
VPWAERGAYVVFAGRLGAEKGVRSLLKAWQHWGAAAPELRLVGDGELRAELEQMAAGLPVRFLGQLPAQEAQSQIANARLLVLPSECFEGFPMVVREAFAFGTPVAASRLGPLPSIVLDGQQGVLFEPAAPNDLFQKLQALWSSGAELERLGVGAHQAFLDKYTQEANYQQLMAIYQSAIQQQQLGIPT